jgi:hypothetical protein
MTEPGFESSLNIGGPNTGAILLSSEIATVISVNLLSIGGPCPLPPLTGDRVTVRLQIEPVSRSAGGFIPHAC